MNSKCPTAVTVNDDDDYGKEKLNVCLKNSIIDLYRSYTATYITRVFQIAIRDFDKKYKHARAFIA